MERNENIQTVNPLLTHSYIAVTMQLSLEKAMCQLHYGHNLVLSKVNSPAVNML